MASDDRWANAQAYERSYWESQAARIAEGEDPGLSWYKWRAGRLKEMIANTFPADELDLATARVLEVGSGPVGVVSYLEAKEAIALDPLCDYYSSEQALVQHRGSGVEFVKGTGESIPYDDGHFDFLIIDNVIDHVKNVDGVMKEVHRVIRPNGILYLTVNLHPAWGFALHRVVSTLQIDRGHPHTFTLPKIRKFLSHHGFDVKHDEWGDYREAKREDLASASLKDRLKGLSGLSEFLYASLSRKR